MALDKPKADLVRVRVFAIDGTELSPAIPQKVRKLLETNVAHFVVDGAGNRVLQMKRSVGTTVPHPRANS